MILNPLNNYIFTIEAIVDSFRPEEFICFDLFFFRLKSVLETFINDESRPSMTPGNEINSSFQRKVKHADEDLFLLKNHVISQLPYAIWTQVY